MWGRATSPVRRNRVAFHVSFERMAPAFSSRPTIGVFDSGVGGLTVLRALMERIPEARYLYFGDTARLPYGSKSAATVAHYAVGAIRHLRSEEHTSELQSPCNLVCR